MRPLQDWLDEYGESHRHPFNKRMHWLCVPLIMFSLLGLLWVVPRPSALAAWPAACNWASLLAVLALVYYLLLAPRLAPPMGLLAGGMLVCLWGLQAAGAPVLWLSLAVFALAWVGQFIGHHVEGRKPSFLRDIQFLMIGPLWLIAFVYRRLNWRY